MAEKKHILWEVAKAQLETAGFEALFRTTKLVVYLKNTNVTLAIKQGKVSQQSVNKLISRNNPPEKLSPHRTIIATPAFEDTPHEGDRSITQLKRELINDIHHQAGEVQRMGVLMLSQDKVGQEWLLKMKHAHERLDLLIGRLNT